ncbi:Cof-type HAD-IIB family hydrolase [Oscillospiraceae bacterium PP1C4]
MAIKLSDLVITTDIDGTLLHAPHSIPRRNIEAIERFTKKGGRFAIASGRSIESARQYAKLLPINMPCILFNGSGIYDYDSEKLLYGSYLPDTYRVYTETILSQFPTIGAILLNQKEMYSVSDLHYSEKYLGIEKQPFIASDLDSLEGDFFKLILSMDAQMIAQVDAFTASQGWEDVTFVRSSPNFFEMLPSGINKGTGLQHLVDCIGVSIEQTVSIGDYYNDFEMLQTAAFPATVKDAPDDIKEICKLVTGGCMDGAVADLIEHLEETYPLA